MSRDRAVPHVPLPNWGTARRPAARRAAAWRPRGAAGEPSCASMSTHTRALPPSLLGPPTRARLAQHFFSAESHATRRAAGAIADGGWRRADRRLRGRVQGPNHHHHEQALAPIFSAPRATRSGRRGLPHGGLREGQQEQGTGRGMRTEPLAPRQSSPALRARSAACLKTAPPS